jgi:lipopolysaccharide biosynthesis glycosyltransferase
MHRSRAEHPLVLVCGADDAFAKPLAVTLYSAVSNYRGSVPVNVYIINGGITRAKRERIDRILGLLGATVNWLEPDWTPVRGLVVSDRYPASTYLRLLIPTFLPEWVDKAIYLDSDVVVHGNLAELWNVDFGGAPLLAAQDKGVPTVGSPLGLANHRDLGLDPATLYFNSGVLVFDLGAWRERQLAAQVIDYIATHPDQAQFGEQNALNATLAGAWRALDGRWNQQVWAWEAESVGETEYQPGILHFVYTSKPWDPAGAHWTNFIYDRYLRYSGWYTPIEWWRYYLPLLVHRQHVLSVRARSAAARK